MAFNGKPRILDVELEKGGKAHYGILDFNAGLISLTGNTFLIDQCPHQSRILLRHAYSIMDMASLQFNSKTWDCDLQQPPSLISITSKSSIAMLLYLHRANGIMKLYSKPGHNWALTAT